MFACVSLELPGGKHVASAECLDDYFPTCKVEPRAPWRKKAYKITSSLNIEGGRIRSKVSTNQGISYKCK